MKKTLAEALEARGYTSLTDVQQAVTAPELTGKDLLVSAQTGSGKTLAFGLAIAPGLLGEADHFERAAAPLALVIAPTRELALQVQRELGWLFEKAGGVIASTVGGMDMRDERRALARGAHIVVATPGRLRDHIMRGSIALDALRAVVLDEADEMLDLGFREDLEFILETAPETRQTLLFSATVPPAIGKLAQGYQQDALRIESKSGTRQHADIEYKAFQVASRDAENAIINVLRYYEAPNTIVFCNTRAMVTRLTTRLSNRGFSVVALSGELSQTERSHALQAMRDGRARVCVATDVAARGIDLPNLDLVIHAELPSNQETLLHRSGRTGRAQRKGVSALIVPGSSRKKAQRLLGWAKLTADWTDAPGAAEVLARDEERLLADPDFAAPIEESDQGTVQKLTDAFSAEQLAAAYLRLYRSRHSAPEELSDVNAPPKARAPFGPSTWFSLEGGREDNADPGRILAVLCNVANVAREDVGAIRIQQNATFIELRQSAVETARTALGPQMILLDGAPLVALDTPPTFERAPRRKDGPRPRKERTRDEDRPRPKPRREDHTPTRAPAHHERAAEKTPRKEADKGRVKTDRTPAPATAKPAAKPAAKPKGSGAKYAAPKAERSKTERAKPLGTDLSQSGRDRPRGPKPPPGKPSSKKNRARKLAAKTAGTAPPRRPRKS